jgi:hypothetical protein
MLANGLRHFRQPGPIFGQFRDLCREKNLIPFCGGLPKGLSKRVAIRIGTSCGWQPSTQAACSTVSRAGGRPTNAKN